MCPGASHLNILASASSSAKRDANETYLTGLCGLVSFRWKHGTKHQRLFDRTALCCGLGFPFYRWRKGGSGHLNNVPRFPQPVSGHSSAHIQVSLTLDLTSSVECVCTCPCGRTGLGSGSHPRAGWCGPDLAGSSLGQGLLFFLLLCASAWAPLEPAVALATE